MKRHIIQKIILLIFGLTLFLSCTQDDDAIVVEKTVEGIKKINNKLIIINSPRFFLKIQEGSHSYRINVSREEYSFYEVGDIYHPL
jgi:hypothetical protein